MRALVIVMLLAAAAHADALVVGDKLAELDVAVDRAGKPVKLAAFRGRWVLITIGAAWCLPCQKELPIWDQLAAEFAGRITFIALDIDDDVKDGIAFHDRLKLRNMVRIYLPQETSAVVGRYGADKMPSTFIADPGGVVRYAHGGYEAGDAAKLRATLAALVPAKPKPAPPKPVPPPPKPEGALGIVVPAHTPPVLWSAAWSSLLRF
ncbi:MAG: TlpA disulfide reductase family protein [Kofleriaceae bacterium]